MIIIILFSLHFRFLCTKASGQLFEEYFRLDQVHELCGILMNFILLR